MIQRFEWVQASSVQEALSALAEGGMIKAGGIDVIDRLKEGLDRPSRLINIRGIEALDGVKADAAGLSIGPLATLARISEDRSVLQGWPALAEAAAAAATPQIRNVATAGGNLLQRPRCWYFRSELFPCRKKGGEICFAQDGENDYHALIDNGTCAAVHPSSLAVPLVAFGATIDLVSGKGKRSIPLESFFTPAGADVTREHSLQAGEILTAIRVPPLPAGARSAYVKIAEKESFDWPIAEVAVTLAREGTTVRRASIVLGAAAHTPWRAKEAEAALSGKELTARSAAAAGEASMRQATPLSRNAYKVPIFQVAVRRALLAAGGPGGA
jgi:xanthine dehydrogenase YagS FAD-binding subunit